MQSSAFKLLKEKNFQELYDLSVGKVFSNRIEMQEYVGAHSNFDTDLATCTLKLDEKEFAVDYIGTYSLADNMWFTAELEKQIPDQGVSEIITVRKLFSQIGLSEFYAEKLQIDGSVTADMLATIYTAFMPEQQVYYVGKAGDVSLYMRVKGLPSEVLAPIASFKFVPRVMEIISTGSVKNHKLMVESFLLNNGCTVKVKGNKVVGVFNETEITFTFDEQNRLINTEGVLGDAGKKEEANDMPIEEPAVEEAPVVLPEVNEEAPVVLPETKEETEEEPIIPTVLPEVEDEEVAHANKNEELIEEEVNLPEVETTAEDLQEAAALMETMEDIDGANDEEIETIDVNEEAPVVLPETNEEEVFKTPVETTEEAIEERPVVLPEIEDVETEVAEPTVVETEVTEPQTTAVPEIEDVAEVEEEPIIPTVLPAVEDEEVTPASETEEPIEEESEEDDEEYNKIVELADAMLNCSEQIGLFDELGVEDEETINKICTATAIRILNNGDTYEVVRDSLIAACERNGITVRENTANLFASCYIDSYHNAE